MIDSSYRHRHMYTHTVNISLSHTDTHSKHHTLLNRSAEVIKVPRTPSENNRFIHVLSTMLDVSELELRSWSGDRLPAVV